VSYLRWQRSDFGGHYDFGSNRKDTGPNSNHAERAKAGGVYSPIFARLFHQGDYFTQGEVVLEIPEMGRAGGRFFPADHGVYCAQREWRAGRGLKFNTEIQGNIGVADL